MQSPTLYLAADHRGFSLKERVKEHARSRGLEVIDLTPERVEGDDYTAVAELLAKRIAGLSDVRGILSCGSGTGIAIAANRFKGIRAAVGIAADQVAVSRNDDDANVLVLAADFVIDQDAFAMADALTDTPFEEEEERYVRRRDALDQLGS